MKGLKIRTNLNSDESVGIWFGTNGSHWSGISGQRKNASTTWGTDLRFYTHENAATALTYARERMRIDSEGNVGIGTANPAKKLHISSGVNMTPTTLRIENTDTSIETNQEVNTIEFYSNDASASGTGVSGKIAQYAVNPGNQYGLAFSTYNVSESGLEERMRIHHNGNVGIGTTTPASFSNQTSLTVQGTSIGRVDVKGAGGAGGGALLAWSEGMALATNSNWPLEIGVGVSYIHFKTSGAERMRIDSSGNVGIGTDSPDTLLELVNAHPILTLRSSNTSTSNSNATLRLAESGANDVLNNYWDIKFEQSNSGHNNLVFNHNSVGERLRLFDTGSAFTGNVGIGTTTPQAKLSVNTPLSNSSADMRALDIVVPGSWSQSGNAGHTSDITWTNNTGSGSIMGKFGLRYSGTTTNGACEWVFKDMYQGGFGASGDIMFIGSNGIVLTPKQPAFRVDQTGASGLGTGNYTVAFSEPSGTSFDIGNNFSGNVFTAPVAGTYHFSTSCRVDAAGVPYFRILISKNNSTDTNTNLHSIYGSPAATYENLQVSGLLYLAQGDTARVLIVSSSDTSWNSQGEGHFSGHLIG